MASRRDELTEAAYRHVLEHGLTSLSLRPLADAIGTSTGVLRFLFGSKDGLVDTLLGRVRDDERAVLASLDPRADLAETAVQLWLHLAAPRHRPALVLWLECYGASLVDPGGPLAGAARDSVAAWLDVLARAQPPRRRDTAAGAAERTAVLALLRGCLIDLLATGDVSRTTRAVRDGLARLV